MCPSVCCYVIKLIHISKVASTELFGIHLMLLRFISQLVTEVRGMKLIPGIHYKILVQISAAYVNVAMRSTPDLQKLKECSSGPMNEVRARAFAVMTNLAFALKVALKGKLPLEREVRILSNRKGHDLKEVFQNLPKCD